MITQATAVWEGWGRGLGGEGGVVGLRLMRGEPRASTGKEEEEAERKWSDCPCASKHTAHAHRFILRRVRMPIDAWRLFVSSNIYMKEEKKYLYDMNNVRGK